MTLTQLFSQSRPVLLVREGDGPTLIVNRDITNAVLYGEQSIASGNVNEYSVLDPLGSITVDGTSDIYAIPNAGTPTLDVVQGAGAWSASPAQIALQMNALGLAKDTTVQTTNTNTTGLAKDTTLTGVNTTLSLGTNPNLVTINSTLGIPAQTADVTGLTVNGIPLLRGTTQLGQASAQTLAAATTATLLNGTLIVKPSFESVFKLNLPAAAGTIPFAILGVGWQDAVTGLQVGFKQYVLTAGNGPANAILVYLSGPCRGNQIVLTLKNLDPAQTLTYSWLFNVTSHVYSVDRLLQPSYTGGVITFNVPGGNPSKGVLVMTQASVPATGNITRLLAASNAKCSVLFDNSTVNACNLILQDPGTLYDGGTATQNIVRFNHAVNQSAVYEFQMPNGPVNMVIQNTAAGAVSPGVAIMIKEY